MAKPQTGEELWASVEPLILVKPWHMTHPSRWIVGNHLCLADAEFDLNTRRKGSGNLLILGVARQAEPVGFGERSVLGGAR